MLGEQCRMPNGYARTAVYVKGYGEHDINGYIIHEAANRAWKYGSLMELLRIYGGLLDRAKYPQETHELRRIGKPDKEGIKEMEANTVDIKRINKSEKPTFIVNIQYRQNASWQGTINWVEGGVTQHFRSTLEMIRLMDDAIAGQDETAWENKQS